MAGLNIRTVISLLDDLHPDPDLIYIALGRQTAVNALAAVVGGIGAAIADLDQKICPTVKEHDRSRKDRRWHSFLTAMDRAARTAGDLDQALQGAAGRCPRVIADGEPVLYHGSLKPQHGLYAIDGPCICDRCEDVFTLQLRPARPGHGLTCVNPTSISPAPPPHRLDSGHRLERVLHAEISALPTPIGVDHAVSLVRAMVSVTGRSSFVLNTWHEPMQQRFAYGWWVFDPAGSSARLHLRHILDTLARIGPALTTVQADLRKAIGVLADIGDNPNPSREAAA
jgi:hypothetical protein